MLRLPTSVQIFMKNYINIKIIPINILNQPQLPFLVEQYINRLLFKNIFDNFIAQNINEIQILQNSIISQLFLFIEVVENQLTTYLCQINQHLLITSKRQIRTIQAVFQEKYHKFKNNISKQVFQVLLYQKSIKIMKCFCINKFQYKNNKKILYIIKTMISQEIQSWDSLKNFIKESYKSKSMIVDQCLYAENQQILLNQIKDQIMNKTVSRTQNCGVFQRSSRQSTCQSLTVTNTEISTEFNQSIILKGKFLEQLQQKLLQNAMEEVQMKCSQQTYQLVKANIENLKNVEFNSMKRNLQKCKKQVEKLNSANMILMKEKANNQWQLSLLKPKLQNMENQKVKIKKSLEQLTSKQRLLLSIETSLVLKEKMINERKKKYEKEQKTAQQIKNQLENTNQQFWKIYQKISEKCSQTKCGQDCWKRDVMNKFKLQFMQFKQQLKQQEQQLENQYVKITNISDQFKILVSKSEKLINITKQ